MLPPPATSSELRALAAKGRILHDELVEAIALRGQSYVPLPEIAPAYKTQIGPPETPDLDDRQVAFLRLNGHPTDGYHCVEGWSCQPEQRAYVNHVHKDGRVILCMFNYTNCDGNAGGPNQKYWSDLMAVFCQRAMAGQGARGIRGGTMANLEAIWRLTIDNHETNSVIRSIDIRRSLDRESPGRYIDLRFGEDDFFALLGTVHGKGPIRMLAAFPQMFGCKTIVGVRLYPAVWTNLCWFLA